MGKPSIYSISERIKKIEKNERRNHIIAEIDQNGTISFRTIRTGKTLNIEAVKIALSCEDTFVLFLDFELFPVGNKAIDTGNCHSKEDKDYQEWKRLINFLRTKEM